MSHSDMAQSSESRTSFRRVRFADEELAAAHAATVLASDSSEASLDFSHAYESSASASAVSKHWQAALHDSSSDGSNGSSGAAATSSNPSLELSFRLAPGQPIQDWGKDAEEVSSAAPSSTADPSTMAAAQGTRGNAMPRSTGPDVTHLVNSVVRNVLGDGSGLVQLRAALQQQSSAAKARQQPAPQPPPVPPAEVQPPPPKAPATAVAAAVAEFPPLQELPPLPELPAIAAQPPPALPLRPPAAAPSPRPAPLRSPSPFAQPSHSGGPPRAASAGRAQAARVSSAARHTSPAPRSASVRPPLPGGGYVGRYSRQVGGSVSPLRASVLQLHNAASLEAGGSALAAASFNPLLDAAEKAPELLQARVVLYCVMCWFTCTIAPPVSCECCWVCVDQSIHYSSACIAWTSFERALNVLLLLQEVVKLKLMSPGEVKVAMQQLEAGRPELRAHRPRLAADSAAVRPVWDRVGDRERARREAAESGRPGAQPTPQPPLPAASALESGSASGSVVGALIERVPQPRDASQVRTSDLLRSARRPQAPPANGFTPVPHLLRVAEQLEGPDRPYFGAAARLEADAAFLHTDNLWRPATEHTAPDSDAVSAGVRSECTTTDGGAAAELWRVAPSGSNARMLLDGGNAAALRAWESVTAPGAAAGAPPSAARPATPEGSIDSLRWRTGGAGGAGAPRAVDPAGGAPPWLAPAAEHFGLAPARLQLNAAANAGIFPSGTPRGWQPAAGSSYVGSDAFELPGAAASEPSTTASEAPVPVPVDYNDGIAYRYVMGRPGASSAEPLSSIATASRRTSAASVISAISSRAAAAPPAARPITPMRSSSFSHQPLSAAADAVLISPAPPLVDAASLASLRPSSSGRPSTEPWRASGASPDWRSIEARSYATPRTLNTPVPAVPRYVTT